MEVFVVSLLNGLVYGMLLFMLASGLTLILSMMGVLNFAHASAYMLGAYFAYSLSKATGSFVIGVPLAFLATLIFGMALERFVLRTLYSRDHLDQVLATFGLILFFNQAIILLFGRQPLFVQIPEFLSGSLQLLPGLKYSTFAKTVHGKSFVILFNFIKGVLPIVSSMLFNHII